MSKKEKVQAKIKCQFERKIQIAKIISTFTRYQVTALPEHTISRSLYQLSIASI